MGRSCRFQLAVCLQAFQPVLPDGFEHQQAWLLTLLLCLLHQALVDERCHPLEQLWERLSIFITSMGGGLDDGGESFQPAAANEDREVTKEALLLSAQQVITPLDSIAQRPLAHGQIAWAPGEEVEAMGKAMEQG